MTTGPKPFSKILSDALELVKQLLSPLAIGAVIFGLLTVVVGGSVMAGTVGMGGIGRFEGQVQEFQQKMDALNQRMAAGDPSAMDDFELPDAELGAMQATMWSFLPAILGGAVVMIIISIVSRAYMTIVLVKKIDDPMAAVQGFGKHLIPLVLLWLWLVLRSFVWIPFIGWVIGIVLIPRFVASPIYLLEHNKGVTESVRESMRVTTGAWLRIVLPCLTAAILAGIASAILGGFLGNSGMILGAVLAVANELLSAYVMATGIVVARDVIAHPTAKVLNA